jgi:hypothetical protein
MNSLQYPYIAQYVRKSKSALISHGCGIYTSFRRIGIIGPRAPAELLHNPLASSVAKIRFG